MFIFFLSLLGMHMLILGTISMSSIDPRDLRLAFSLPIILSHLHVLFLKFFFTVRVKFCNFDTFKILSLHPGHNTTISDHHISTWNNLGTYLFTWIFHISRWYYTDSRAYYYSRKKTLVGKYMDMNPAVSCIRTGASRNFKCIFLSIINHIHNDNIIIIIRPGNLFAV